MFRYLKIIHVETTFWKTKLTIKDHIGHNNLSILFRLRKG